MENFNYNVYCQLWKEVLDEMKEVFPQINNNTYVLEVNSRWTNIHAACTTNRNTNQYRITINTKFAKACTREHVKNTLVHELLHSLPGGMNHTGKWVEYAARVNHIFPHYKITRTSSYSEYNKVIEQASRYTIMCPNCNHEWHYQKASSVVKNPHLYKCKCGQHGLKLKGGIA